MVASGAPHLGLRVYACSVARPSDYVIQGRELTLPLQIRRATGGLGVFTADAERVGARLPTGLLPIRLGGRALVVLMLVDYLDNPLGDYDEGVVGFAAAPAGASSTVKSIAGLLRGRVGMWVEHMPVSEAFTREAGETIWGYPKTVDELAIEHGPYASFTWARDGERILRLEVKSGGMLVAPPIRGTTYTLIDGIVHRTRMTSRASGVRVGPRGARVELGSHPVGRRLAELDISPTAIGSVWLTQAAMSFEASVPL
jgi:hypothetical protein